MIKERAEPIKVIKDFGNSRIPKSFIIINIFFICNLLIFLFFHPFSKYRWLLYPLAEQDILRRYILSIALRVFMVILGAGILLRNEISRKLIIFINCFIIMTIYWKHPAICFENIKEMLITRGLITPDMIPGIESLMFGLRVFWYIFDISIALFLIYFFTRLDVKKQFK